MITDSIKNSSKYFSVHKDFEKVFKFLEKLGKDAAGMTILEEGAVWANVFEIGEVIDIVKKHGGEKACSDENLRKDLIEELADVLMYYNDILLCYGISSEELKQTYTQKFEKNMKRW